MRVGELCNLDLRDLHLESGPNPDVDVDSRVQIESRPDSLFVSLGTLQERRRERGRTHGFEQAKARYDDSRRRRSFERTLLEWLAIRPDARSPAEPCLRVREPPGETTHTGHGPPHGGDARPRARVVSRRRRSGGERHPHYFRHFFTTHLRDRTGDRGIVKYLRGDVAQDVIDTYTHDGGSCQIRVPRERLRTGV